MHNVADMARYLAKLQLTPAAYSHQAGHHAQINFSRKPPILVHMHTHNCIMNINHIAHRLADVMLKYCHFYKVSYGLCVLCVFNIPVLTCSVQCMKILCIVVSPEHTGGATVKELSPPDGE